MDGATTWLLGDVAAGQLLIRMLTTAAVVVGVAVAVARLGPAVGGSLAGLPIVLGPGFFFLMQEADARFVAAAAANAVLSLTATQLFLLAYIAIAHRARPLITLLAALGTWAASAMAFQTVPQSPYIGLLLFASFTLIAWQAGKAFLRSAPVRVRVEDKRMLVVRGLLAGLLVAAVTAASDRLGPTASGVLMAFPVGYTVLSVTLHEQMGAHLASATLHSAVLGTIGLAGFCATLAFSASVLPPGFAFLASLMVSLAVTLALAGRSWRRGMGPR